MSALSYVTLHDVTLHYQQNDHDLSSTYWIAVIIAEDCQLLTDIGRRSLRSANVLTCATKRTRTCLGDRSFSDAGPCLWNSLPVALCDRDISLVQFKRLSKTLWFV